jgi:23S rRNA pseudouridine2605 synthase
MRINKYLAQAVGMSRRTADKAVEAGRVQVNGTPAQPGTDVTEADTVMFNGRTIALPTNTSTIILNKPVGYVVSRDGQGSRTIYELLPAEFHNLKPVGRLDKDSSGLLLLTNDGTLAHELTHPSFQKTKIYEIELNKPLEPLHQQMISDHGIMLEDGNSKLQLEKLHDNHKTWKVTMQEGRNRQIRRTFQSLGYKVTKLHRTHFGSYALTSLSSGQYEEAIG